MHRSRGAIVAVLAAMLMITALATPTAAADGKGAVAVVNGIPGERVDVCINGREIESRLAYGGIVSRRLPEGDKVLKVFRADSRTCRGTKLAQKSFALVAAPNPGSDFTLVATRHNPMKVVVFDNVGLGVLPHDGAPFAYGYIAWRHASDHGDVNLHYRLGVGGPIGPAANPIWQKGNQYLEQVGLYALALRATYPEAAGTLARAPLTTTAPERRYEWYLLGTNKKNAKFIVLTRHVSAPAP